MRIRHETPSDIRLKLFNLTSAVTAFTLYELRPDTTPNLFNDVYEFDNTLNEELRQNISQQLANELNDTITFKIKQ